MTVLRKNHNVIDNADVIDNHSRDHSFFDHTLEKNCVELLLNKNTQSCQVSVVWFSIALLDFAKDSQMLINACEKPGKKVGFV